MILVPSGSVRHFDTALLRKFTNHDDFAPTVRYRSLLVCSVSFLLFLSLICFDSVLSFMFMRVFHLLPRTWKAFRSKSWRNKRDLSFSIHSFPPSQNSDKNVQIFNTYLGDLPSPACLVIQNTHVNKSLLKSSKQVPVIALKDHMKPSLQTPSLAN